MRSRENWIDNIKIFACILVTLGHFFQSMCAVGIMERGHLYQWFIRTIYYFHVPLFFVCSGYVYQKYSIVDSFTKWRKNTLKKLVVLGVPYFAFSLITWGFKWVFSNEVNIEAHGLIYDLFVHPMSPYWFLFAMFFIFLITGTFRNKVTCCICIAVALILKILSNTINCYVVEIIFANMIWFVLGMAVCLFDILACAQKLKILAYVFGGLFVLLSFADSEWLSFLQGLLACSSILILFSIGNKKVSPVAEYTMPIFLMHTIFAAGIRAVLFNLGVLAPWIHISMGLVASFIGPVVTAKFMKKIKLDILYQPGKYINFVR